MRYARVVSLLVGTIVSLAGVIAVQPPAGAVTLTTTQVQWNLAGLAYLSYADVDGANGPKTREAVRRFQIDQCMDADGAAGSLTGDRLVAQMQSVQYAVGLIPDGRNGPNTKQAIVQYQQLRGLVADGRAGPATMGAMGLSPLRECGLPVSGDIRSDSSGVSCVSPTRDLGVHDGYTAGVKVRVRLCAIPGFASSADASRPTSQFYISGANGEVVVNARASGAFLGLFRAARNSGLTLTARSSFRPMAQQQALCQADPGCSTGNYSLVAKPGTSNHQLGAAVDFAGPTPTGGGTCATRATSTNSVWKFLDRNARRFGIKQYARESWHWGVLESC